VLDLMLPGMSGYEVIERLRTQSDLSDLPILVLSALGSASARVRGLREGADDYMTKPFLPEEIVARARTLVTRRLLARRPGGRGASAVAPIACCASWLIARRLPSSTRGSRTRRASWPTSCGASARAWWYPMATTASCSPTARSTR